ncbi:hypothetical protein BU197_04615 [Streptomyces sp. CBMA291]|nr:hypothetical protein [Streptomyces sp. CBMA291]MBD0714947.1 hypothetical protein [Streptomyces sp. CBMA370]
MTEAVPEQVAAVPAAEEEARGGAGAPAGSGNGADGVGEAGNSPVAATVDIPRQQSVASAADSATGDDAGA